MKTISKHSDNIILVCLLLGLIIGAGYFIIRWKINRSNWDTNFNEYSVHPDEMNSGGLGRDGRIRPIDSPLFVSVTSASRLLDAEAPVIAVDYHDAERAYPLHIMAAHEIVNDHIGDVPIAVTFCPLCNSAVVYRREINGQVLRMGVSGNLYGNNFLMYDNLTESWWYQFTGEAVIGDYTGASLDVVPSQVVGFAAFAGRYPNGDVLIGDSERPDINYDMTPYLGYEQLSSPLIESDNYDPRLYPMERVLASTVGDIQIAYPFSILREVGVINDTVNGRAVVAIWQPGANSALGNPNYVTQDVGQAALYGRILNGETLTFRYEDGRIFDTQTGSEWNIFGEAIAGDLHGEALYNYDCYPHFWFAWSTAYPDTLLYEQ